jgi:hypothetical protein
VRVAARRMIERSASEVDSWPPKSDRCKSSVGATGFAVIVPCDHSFGLEASVRVGRGFSF